MPGPAEDLRVGLEHAEEELRLTEMSASFPSGVTLVLLRPPPTRLANLDRNLLNVTTR